MFSIIKVTFVTYKNNKTYIHTYTSNLVAKDILLEHYHTLITSKSTLKLPFKAKFIWFTSTFMSNKVVIAQWLARWLKHGRWVPSHRSSFKSVHRYIVALSYVLNPSGFVEEKAFLILNDSTCQFYYRDCMRKVAGWWHFLS